MKWLLIGPIRFYQKFLSPIKPSCCRYYPTCSQYALEAVKKFGFFRGGYLALRRVARCSPLFPGGVDPVPEEFHFHYKKRK